MRAIDFTEDSRLLNSQFRLLKPVIFYFLSTGRNAWHSTWSEKYSTQASIFGTFKSCKLAAEEIRVKGTSFEIKQIPGLAFYSKLGIVCIAEFHSEPSFKNLNFPLIDVNLRIGSILNEVITPYIKPSAKYWSQPFPHSDSFIVAFSDLHEDLEIISQPFDYRTWKSNSLGSRYFLNWVESEKSKLSPLTRIIDLYNSLNSNFEIAASEAELEITKEKSLHQARTLDQLTSSLDEILGDKGKDDESI